MEKFKSNIKIKFDGDKQKFKEYINGLKIDVEKEIELIVDSQNSEFKGIKQNRKVFDKFVNHFKKLNNIKDI